MYALAVLLLLVSIKPFLCYDGYRENDETPRGFFHSIKNPPNSSTSPRTKVKESIFDTERTLFSLNRFSSSFGDGKGAYCKRPAKCENLSFTTCMGTKLPYTRTTLELVDGLASQDQAQEMCKMVMGPCRILTTYEPWPSVFRCDNTTRYPPKCKNDVRELKFNTTGYCLKPLVQTELSAWYYDGIDGCGVQCEDPMFSDNQRDQIHKMVGWAATLCALNNLFAVFTFMIDWKSSSKYPALAIFYINLCFLIVCLGWLAQFMPGGREDIVCRKDGTLRIAEPSAGENLSCVVVYVMVYYFLMAAIVWFVVLTYAWYMHVTLQVLGKIQVRVEKKGAYFHMIAWSCPLVLTITTMALGEIDGDSVSGICFVGTANNEYRASFLLAPVAVALLIGTYFISKGLITLIVLKVASQEIISKSAASRIKETILRMSVFSVLVIVFGATTFICHFYEFRNSEHCCKLGIGVPGASGECRMASRPSLAMRQLHILSLFVTGILMSTWVWNSITLKIWLRFIAKLMNKEEVEKPSKPKKHKLIAQAYSKRKDLEDGRLSLSLESSHEDPVGLDFELNSGASGSVRSSWAAALPKFITRRGAFVATNNSNSSLRRNSCDSQISYSVKRVSVESRRDSLESGVQVKVTKEELTQTWAKKVSNPVYKPAYKHRSGRKEKRRAPRSRRNSVISERKTRRNRNSASASSNDSNPVMQLMLALEKLGGSNGSNSKHFRSYEYTGIPTCKPKLDRRPANAGLDDLLATPVEFKTNTEKLKFLKHGETSSSSSIASSVNSSRDIPLDILKDIDKVQEHNCS